MAGIISPLPQLARHQGQRFTIDAARIGRKFQSSPDAHMAERLLEYVALLPRALRRSGWMAADGGRVVTHVPLVVYNGRAEWNATLRLDEREWAPPELRNLQPRPRCRLMSALVVCSDSTAGGRGERYEIGADDLVCDVVSEPSAIARRLQAPAGGVKAVFCTYHSLRRVPRMLRRPRDGPRPRVGGRTAACWPVALQCLSCDGRHSAPAAGRREMDEG